MRNQVTYLYDGYSGRTFVLVDDIVAIILAQATYLEKPGDRKMLLELCEIIKERAEDVRGNKGRGLE